MPTEFPVIEFNPDRITALMDAHRFTVDDYMALGFDRSWIQRKAKVVAPRDYRNIFRLAYWLQVPPEYIVGVGPEYDGMEAWKVASLASLDLFFKRHPEGSEAQRYREDFERHVADRRDAAPRTITSWASWFDAYQRGRARERTEAQQLERSVRKPPRRRTRRARDGRP